MRRVIALSFCAAFIFAWNPVNASVISNGNFTFDYGGANILSIVPDPGFGPPWGRATIFSTPSFSLDAESIFVPPVEDYNGSFGGSNYSVQPDFDTASIEWDLVAQNTVPGGRRASSYSLTPLVTLGGEAETLNFSINYEVEAAGDSIFDFTVAQVQVLIGYGTTIFGQDWVPVIDEFSPPAVEFRGFDTSVVSESGNRQFDLTKPPDTPNWIIRMQIIATASDFLPEDSPPPTVPEPATLLLMGLGLAGLGFARRRRLNV